jgi:regulator of nonsense transcripts 1
MMHLLKARGIRSLRIGQGTQMEAGSEGTLQFEVNKRLAEMAARKASEEMNRADGGSLINANAGAAPVNNADVIDDILRECDVLCATCITVGVVMLSSLRFTHVLMDEATQATEVSSLIPLIRGCRKLVLIGDHKQLPPTLLSQRAQELGLGLSLFDRLVRTDGTDYSMLQRQYRMHPVIADFASKHFYNGLLTSAVTAGERPPPKGLDFKNPERPVAFVRVGGESEFLEVDSNGSKCNVREAQAIVGLVLQLLRAGEITKSQIAVISPYSAQTRTIKGMLIKAFAPQALDGLRIDTVDGFQGMEKEVVIVSTVRSNGRGTVGFLRDYRRTNVLLTRARRALVVYGNEHTLRKDETWRSWLEWYAEKVEGAGGGLEEATTTEQSPDKAPPKYSEDPEHPFWAVPKGDASAIEEEEGCSYVSQLDPASAANPKLTLCGYMVATGHCPFIHACNFAHSEEEVRATREGRPFVPQVRRLHALGLQRGFDINVLRHRCQ